jgi:hypothetical protein
MLGTSGTVGERSALVTAMARSLPPLTCGSAHGRLSNNAHHLPADVMGSGPKWGLRRFSELAKVIPIQPRV